MGTHAGQQEACFVGRGISCCPVAIPSIPCKGAIQLVGFVTDQCQQSHTLCTSSTGCGFSLSSGFPGDKSLVRLSPSSLTVMEVTCVGLVKRSCTFPVIISRLVKWPGGLSSTKFKDILQTTGTFHHIVHC